MLIRRKLLARSAAMLLVPAVALSRRAAAQGAAEFPSGPVRVILPLGPGGNMDAFARLVGERLSQVWRVPVVPESRPGANGMLAAAALAAAPPNGSTLLLSHSAVVLNPLLRANAGYRLAQLAPVEFLADLPVAFGLDRRLADGVAAFVALARARPGELAYGSYGAGSNAHIMGELLQRCTGIRLVHVPYRGEAEAITALLGGQVTAVFGSVGGVAQHGDRVALAAVGSARRLPRLPEVPTFGEAGLPLGNLSGWAGAFAPAGTPAAVVAKVAADLRTVLGQDDVIARTRDFGFEPRAADSPPFDAFLRDQTALWTAAIRDAEIRLE